MASPFEIFRRYEWALMAVVGVVCMFVFVIGDALQSPFGGNGTAQDPVIVQTRFGNLTASQVQQLARRRWLAHQVTYLIHTKNQRRRLDDMVSRGELSPQILAMFENSMGQMIQRQVQELFPYFNDSRFREHEAVRAFLLARQAEQMGIDVTDDAVRSFIREQGENQISDADLRSILGEMGRVGLDELAEAMRFELKVLQVREMTLGGLRSLTPDERWDYFERTRALASTEVAPISVEEVAAALPAPSEDALKKFFTEYRDVAYHPDSINPGFAAPYRAKFEYVEADRNTFLAAAAAAVTDADIEARYNETKEQYLNVFGDEPLLPGEEEPAATTTPATGPALELPGAAPATEAPKPEAPKPEAPKPEAPATPAAPADAPKETPAAPATPATETPATPDAPKPSGEARTPRGASDAITTVIRVGDEVAYLQETPAATEAPAAPAAETPATPAADAPKTETPAADAPKTETPAAPATETPATPATETPAKEIIPSFPINMGWQLPTLDSLQGKYKSLNDPAIREQIRQALARERSDAAITAALGKIGAAMRKFGGQYTRWESAPKDEAGVKLEEPKPIDLKALAAQTPGLIYHVTDFVAPFEAVKIEGLGRAFIAEQPFVDYAFSNWRTYLPADAQSVTRNPYIVWKIAEQEPHTPEFSQVKDQVAASWRHFEARRKIRTASDAFVAAVKDSADLSSALVGDAGKKLVEDLKLKEPPTVKRTGPFTWLTRAFSAQGDSQAPPQLTTILQAPDVGNEFMRLVFGLEPNKVGAAYDMPQKTMYVVRLLDITEPSIASFVTATPDQYAALAQNDRQNEYYAWSDSLMLAGNVQWTEASDQFAQ